MENISKVLKIIDKESLTKQEILSIIELACNKLI
jgi:hypothetical protein